MSRSLSIRQVLPLIVLAQLGCSSDTQVEGESASPLRPNVLFIIVDDLNDWVSHLEGYPSARTPNIDRLADRGVSFRRAYCSAPSCNASRTAVLTGMRPSTSGVYQNPHDWREILPENVVSLPRFFGRKGYRTAAYGKIYHSVYPAPDEWDFWHGSPGEDEGRVLGPGQVGGIRFGPIDGPDDGMRDHRNVSAAITELRREHDQPLFLAVGLQKPHMSFSVPKRWFDAIPIESVALPEVLENDLDDVPNFPKRAWVYGEVHQAIVDGEAWRRVVHAYLATVAFADAQVGRLLDALDESDLAENTIVCLWSDHGFHLGEKGHWRKFALWEDALRVPLIIVAPGVTEPGGRCDRPVDLINIYPTLSDLCGLPLRERQLEGLSLRPLLEDTGAEWERPAITTHEWNNHTVRTERWRYIRYRDGSEELYDHDADPHEWSNLAGDERWTPVKAELASWMPKVNVVDPVMQASMQARMQAAQERAESQGPGSEPR